MGGGGQQQQIHKEFFFTFPIWSFVIDFYVIPNSK